MQSALELKETQKYWAKNDELRLADVKSELGPIDPFKSTYTKKQLKDEVADKVQT